MPVLTEPSLASAGPSAPHLGDPSTRRWRAVSPGPRGCAHSGCAYSARCRSGPHQQEAERAATWRRHSSMASARCARDAETVHSAVSVCPHPLGPSRPPLSSNSRGTLRRRRAPAEDSSRRRRRAPPRLLPPGFSHRGRGNGGTADNETAQEPHARLRRRLLT